MTHRYYDSMCRECGDFNYAKREQTADLSGQYALVTGARVKIGFQAALKLLRAGAHVIVTTRFPVDAAERYALESDYPQFKERLQIHGLDLRHSPSVELFTQLLLARLPRLDHLVNNACQTVRRPAAFFAHLLEKESTPILQLPDGLRGAGLIDMQGEELFPAHRYDEDQQQVDLRRNQQLAPATARSRDPGAAGGASGQCHCAVYSQRAPQNPDAQDSRCT